MVHERSLKALLILVVLFLVAPNTFAGRITIDVPLVFDGIARDDRPADGVFDFVSLASPFANARIQNAAVPSITDEDRIIMEFDLTGLLGGNINWTATLILSEFNDDGAPLSLFGDVGDGSANTTDAEITNLLTGPAGAFGDSVVNTAYVDVTSFIQALVSAGDSFALFAIRGADVALGPGSNALHYQIGTSEGGQAPVLRVAVPEPSTLLLLGAGLMGLGVFRKRFTG